jgi:hypothetical protein
MKNLLLLFFAFSFSLALEAKDLPQDLAELKIGDTAPDFDLIGIDDKRHSLKDYEKARVLMIAFISNHCPTSQGIEGRLKKLLSD